MHETSSSKTYKANADRNEKRNSSTVKAGDVNTPLLIMDRLRRSVRKLRNWAKKPIRTNRHRQNTPTNTGYIFLKVTWKTLQDRPYVSHNISQNKFITVKIIQIIFSHQNGMELEINNRRKTSKFTNAWKWNTTLSNTQGVTPKKR